MELDSLIKDLIDSNIIENRELAVTLLNAEEVSPEERKKHIDVFIKEYQEQPGIFFDEEHKALFKAWVEVYRQYVEKQEVLNRVKKIE